MAAEAIGCDILILGGDVIDGSGAMRRRADVAITGDRIAAIGELSGYRGAREIDAKDRVVSPGFIDTHTHDDRLLVSDRSMAAKVSQGVTTVVAGNCGISLAPLSPSSRPVPPLDLLGGEEWFRYPTFGAYVAGLGRQPPATNAAVMVGHMTLRARHMDRFDRAASALEIDAMRADVREALGSGAIGFSTGLGYRPSIDAPTDEVVALAAAAAEGGGLYATHMRSEADDIDGAMEEAFAVGRRAGLPIIISHHKVAGRRNFGRSRATLDRIAAASTQQRVGLDAYPYVAGSTVLLPSDVVERDGRIMVAWSVPHPEVSGRDLDAIAREWGVSPRTAIERLQPAGGIFFIMDEADVRRILSYPDTMIGSDGLPHDSHPHPRLWGAFARVLGHYARDVGLFTLEEAVRRMTSLPAKTFGFADRGVLRRGAFADLVVFDPATVKDSATFDNPKVPAAGIDAVMVNGAVVWRDGANTGATPGQVLRRVAA
ncbi:MAG: D-aminoacylase [Alphaproteobacteria bacterium]|nr:D-aminoacylase [Alphaproteobacteria bacterium]